MRTLLILWAVLAGLDYSVFAQAAALRPGDAFDLRISGVPDSYERPFAGTYSIADDGTVRIPMLKNSVKATGLTSAELAKSIDDRLVAEKIFAHPTTVILLAAQSRMVTLGGPGMRQGTSIPWSNDLTLRSAIKRAGGLGEYPDERKVKVIREGKIQTFNLKKADKDLNQNPKLLPGDEVEVPD